MQPFEPLPDQINNRDDLKKRLSAVLSLYPVSAAYLYGSAVSGKMMPWSDIDIALVMSPQTFDPKRRLELELEIEDKVACDANIRRADVRIINDAPIVVRGEVITSGVLLYSGNEEERVDFETRTRAEYFDFLPTYEMLRQARFERIGKEGDNG